MTIARVFPRRTNATPEDGLVFVDCPPPMLLFDSGCCAADEVHVSVAFTYDIPKAERLAEQWLALGIPVKLGGPAFNEPGGDFVPGRYLRQGMVITSRGCPNRCWFCGVPKREGYALRELPITDGHNILDDNLLACSETHIRAVFAMPARQKERPVFTGGLEARLLEPWHVELLRKVKAKRMYFAYDTPNDYAPLAEAGKLLRQGGFTTASHSAACYVLIGYPGDTMQAAEKRLRQACGAGFLPYAMLYRNERGATDAAWRRVQTVWVNPQNVAMAMRQEGKRL